ncbi:MAG: Structural maintenance of chromosomes protein 5 [Sclerophora amabilis]|nr:MAG: Structural maintenance of chromosomes protein 5 [Sclerophora amabilis]
MPAIPLRRGRTLDSDEDDDDDDDEGQGSGSVPGFSKVTSRGSSASKRARLDGQHDASSPSPSPVPTDGYRANQAERLANRQNGHSAGSYEHQPGAIVRVKLQNFVTYTAAEFFPGPSLNMVIGPNGTGKSTLVCAICLGLGWGPQHLGRAKDVSEYVKHGYHEAVIEIELARRPGVHETNPVIRRQIKREGNKSQYSIDGKTCPLKTVLELARSFSIQIDNLCQFLPQDKVCEFAALSPVELLRSTQRAAAPEYMIEWHDNLKTLRSGQKQQQIQQATDKETLANLDGRQRTLRADVERLKERAGIQDKVRMLECARPFSRYKQALKRHKEMKQQKRDAHLALRKLEDDVEPTLRAVNEKQEYCAQIDKVVKERRRGVERAETATDGLVKTQKEMEDQISELVQETQAEKNQEKERKKDVVRIEGNIKRLEKQIEEVQVDFDPAAYNEKIRERKRRRADIQSQVEEIKGSQKRFSEQGRERNGRIERAHKDLEDLESQAGQQGTKLRQLSKDTSSAWEWIRNHQDQFEHPVFGPPVIECSIKDSKYVDSIESLFQRNDFTCFTVQSRNDFKKLSDQLYKTLRLADITIRTSTVPLDEYQPPVSEQRMREYGFEGWAIDFIKGPDPVLAMLCGECRIHQTGVALQDVSDRQYETLQNSSLSSWVSGKSSFQITRRREYGPGATSTRVRDLKRAQVWTSQPVDVGARRDLQKQIAEWDEDLKELKQQVVEANEKLGELRREYKALEDEEESLAQEKAVKQRAQASFRAFPTRLAQERDKLATLEQNGSELKNRLLKISDRIDASTIEKGQGAIEYAEAVEKLQLLHSELFQAEIMHLEASSDVEVLRSRNSAVRDMLEAKRREVGEIARESETVSQAAKRHLGECQKVLSDQSSSDEYRQFISTLPEEQTPEDLETEIAAEKARLELVHEGNPNAIAEYENRQRTIDKLREKLEEMEERLEAMQAGITEIRDKWEPELDGLVRKISDAFAYSFEKIGCAGHVDVYKDEEDFDQWAIQIQVKFRENEPLSLLTSHRQSGGERAVSTIFYLMALQSLAQAPFRVVDEINQGMDPRNERMVHERLVDIACGEDPTNGAVHHHDDRSQRRGPTDTTDDDNHHQDAQQSESGSRSRGRGNRNGNGPPGSGRQTSQYFLITPKLLNGLRYHERMTVCCIVSGEYMPDTSEKGMVGRLDFGKLVAKKKRGR